MGVTSHQGPESPRRRRGSRFDWAVALLAFLLGPGPGDAQTLDVYDPLEDRLRLLQISGEAPAGSFSLRPLVFREDVTDLAGVGAQPIGWSRAGSLGSAGWSSELRLDAPEARLRLIRNSRIPTVANDGVVWQGRGVTTALDVGTALRWRGLRVSIRPTLVWNQNAAFTLAPVTVSGQPEYAYPWRAIDLPQRFGPDAFWTLHPGQSEVRLSGFGATAGFGTRNLWWGPGIRNAIVLSNNAGGFPHAFLGTRGPRDVGIGTLEANWIWGRLQQSDWFDPDVENDSRYVTGLVLAYNPSFLPGLSVGGTRMFYAYVPVGGVSFSDYFLVFQGITKQSQATAENPRGNDERDQMLSIFARWVLAESAFEVYAEWSRNDHSANLTDFVLEPEHSQGYTLGLQKALALADGRRLALRGELTHLQRAPTFLLRASPPYYTHHLVTQGYTQQGQVVGAGVGPGGNQQHVGVDLYDSWGRVGVMLQRRVADNDAFYEWAEANGGTFNDHDVSFDLGLNGLWFRAPLQLGGGVILTRQLNRYFFGRSIWNWNVSLEARWRPLAD